MVGSGSDIMLNMDAALIDEEIFAEAFDRAVGGEFFAVVVILGGSGEDFGDETEVENGVGAACLELEGFGDRHDIRVGVEIPTGNPKPLIQGKNS